MKELFAQILNISISAGILIVVCVLVRLIFRKMPKSVRCLMWLLVAVRLAIPFNIESPFSLQPAREYVTISSDEEASVGVNEAEKTADATDKESGKEIVTLKDDIKNDVNNFDFMYAFSIIWIIGVAAILIYAVVAYIRLRQTVGDAVLLKNNIYQSERVGTAFILGIFSPKIYVPYGLNEIELFMTLNHERAHLARRDHLLKPLGFIITAVYWFNPLVWLAYILLCKDIELACDEKVIKKIGYDKKKDYSQTLLNLSIPRKYISACPVAFGEVGINERIKNVLKIKKSKKIVITAAVALCAILAVCFLTYPRNRKTASPEPAKTQVSENTEKVEEIKNEDNDGSMDLSINNDSADSSNGKNNNTPVDETEENNNTQVGETEDVNSNTEMCVPVIGTGIITRGFSDDHPGIDISAEEGTDVVSIYNGTVEDVGFNNQEGNYIIISNSDGCTVKYSHLKDTPVVLKGAGVESGEKVGAVGSTGKSTGPHVHVEIIDENGQYVDPMSL